MAPFQSSRGRGRRGNHSAANALARISAKSSAKAPASAPANASASAPASAPANASASAPAKICSAQNSGSTPQNWKEVQMRQLTDTEIGLRDLLRELDEVRKALEEAVEENRALQEENVRLEARLDEASPKKPEIDAIRHHMASMHARIANLEDGRLWTLPTHPDNGHLG